MRVASKELTYGGSTAGAKVEEAARRFRWALRAAASTWWARLFRQRQIATGGVPVDVLLAEMEAYPWDSVEDLILTDRQRREKLQYYNSVLDRCGISPSGLVLNLACGPVSLGYLYKDVVSVDIDPRCVKEVRRNHLKGVIADIYNLPFEEGSFDYVVAIDPPLVPIILHQNGMVRFAIDPVATSRLVNGALKIARKKVVLISFFIARFAPCPEMIEKRVLGPPDYVIYRANGGHLAI